jgi:hypothetical protein
MSIFGVCMWASNLSPFFTPIKIARHGAEGNLVRRRVEIAIFEMLNQAHVT